MRSDRELEGRNLLEGGRRLLTLCGAYMDVKRYGKEIAEVMAKRTGERGNVGAKI